MKTRTLYKVLSMLLTVTMVLNMGLTPVFAEGTTPPDISGVCTHHTEHTEDCGYKQGTPCNHEHTEDCYTKELTCVLTPSEAPEIATDSEAVLDSGEASAGESHSHSEDCYTQTETCQHEHDDACGYTPDSTCTFDPASCTQCNTGDKQPKQVCTCEPVDSGELVHGTDCPLGLVRQKVIALTELWVNGVNILVEGATMPSGVSFDQSTSTLTLTNATLDTVDAVRKNVIFRQIYNIDEDSISN